jgi:hypothetical protein
MKRTGNEGVMVGDAGFEPVIIPLRMALQATLKNCSVSAVSIRAPLYQSGGIEARCNARQCQQIYAASSAKQKLAYSLCHELENNFDAFNNRDGVPTSNHFPS